MAAYSIISGLVRPSLANAAALPALAVVAVALFWAWRYGGFSVTRWYPGAVALLLVLAALTLGARPRLRELSRSVQVALGAMALFTAWSFASIAWADAQGVAWDGANRTLLYLVMFAIPVLCRLDGPRGLVVVGGWTAGIIVLAVAVLLALPDAIGPGRPVLGPGVGAPTGYSNAQACLLVMAAWPAVVLSTRAAVHPALRALFAGGAVVLLDVALLAESRGAEIAAGICLVVVLVAFPGRVRTLLGLLPIAVGVALTASKVRDVSNAIQESRTAIGELDTVVGPVLLAAALVALAVLAIAMLERRTPVEPGLALRVRRAVGVAAVSLAVVGVAVALVAVGDPIDRVDTEWNSFRRAAGVPTDGQAAFMNGFGGARYDYYRVALDLVEENPLGGVGADNFAQDYAARGRAIEFPAFVHSLEIRTLVHTGIFGGLLLAVALGAALLAAWRAARVEGGQALPAAASVAATMCAVHWLVQGSADFFWEFPALGGAAFALLGVACSLAPRPAVPASPRTAPRGLRMVGLGTGALALVAALASLALPWMSAIEVQRASKLWPTDAPSAFDQLDVAADLNPLSSQPALVEGTIALRLNRLDDARAAFTQALDRDPRESYATVALGAIASQQGDRPRALGLLRRAVTLNRQDAVTRSALDRVRAGERIQIPDLIEQFETLARNASR